MAAPKRPKAIKSAVDRWFMAQYQRKRRREQDTPEQRYFRTNSGTTDYIQLDNDIEISAGEDFSLRFISAPSVGDRFKSICGSLDGTAWLRIDSLSTLTFRDGAVSESNVTLNTPLVLNAFNKCELVRSGDTIYFYVNDALSCEFSRKSRAFIVSTLLKYQYGSYFPGCVKDFSILKSGTLTNSWAIDDNSDTIVDSIGGNNGTVINGDPGDWELFTKVGNTWVGNTSGEVIPIAY